MSLATRLTRLPWILGGGVTVAFGMGRYVLTSERTSSAIDLTESQLEEFDRNGFIVIPNVFTIHNITLGLTQEYLMTIA